MISPPPPKETVKHSNDKEASPKGYDQPSSPKEAVKSSHPKEAPAGYGQPAPSPKPLPSTYSGDIYASYQVSTIYSLPPS